MRVRPRHVGRMCRCTQCGNPIYVTYDVIRPRLNLYDKKLPRMFDESDVPVYWKRGDLLMELYEVREEIDAGGMATVYRIRHRAWDTDLAVKFPKPELIPSEKWMEVFENECRTWIDLPSYPHIVDCFYVRRLGGVPRVFMEFVRSTSLHRLVRRKDFYSNDPKENLPRMLDILIQLAWALAFAHDRGIIHQDVKPPNVLVRPNGYVKVTDFGLARIGIARESSADGDGRKAMPRGGTPIYRSPEQERDVGVCFQSDMWGWGLSALELFAGGIVWRDSLAARKTLAEFVERGSTSKFIPKLPADVIELLYDCFADDPGDRPASMDDIAAVLMSSYESETGLPYRRNKPEPGDETPENRNNRAVSLLDLSDDEGSERLWKELLEDEPGFFPARYNRDLYLWRRGRITDAQIVERARDYVDEAPDDIERVTLLARVLMERGDIADATAILEPLHRNHPEDRDVAFAYAMAQSLEDRDFKRLADLNVGALPECLAIENDAHRIYVGLSDGRIGSIEFGLGRTADTVGWHGARITGLLISEQQKRLLSGSEDGTIALWKVSDGATVFAVHAHSKAVTAIALSVSGRNAASGCVTGTARVWDIDTGEPVCTLRGDGESVAAMNFSRCGAFLATGGGKGRVRVWDIWKSEAISEFTASGEKVVAVYLNADTTKAVTASGRYVELWDLETGECVKQIVAHEEPLTSLQVTADTRFAVSATSGRTAKCWNLETGQCLRSLRLQGPVALTVDGHYLAGRSVRNRVEIWPVFLDIPPFGAPFAVARSVVTAYEEEPS